MRIPAARVSLEPAQCIFCVYRIRMRHPLPSSRREPQRRSIQISHPTKHVAQTAAAAAVSAEHEEPNDSNQNNTEALSSSLGNQPRPATIRRWQNFTSAEAVRSTLDIQDSTPTRSQRDRLVYNAEPTAATASSNRVIMPLRLPWESKNQGVYGDGPRGQWNNWPRSDRSDRSDRQGATDGGQEEEAPRFRHPPWMHLKLRPLSQDETGPNRDPREGNNSSWGERDSEFSQETRQASKGPARGAATRSNVIRRVGHTRPNLIRRVGHGRGQMLNYEQSSQSVPDPWSLPIPSSKEAPRIRFDIGETGEARESNRSFPARDTTRQEGGELKARAGSTGPSYLDRRRAYREDRAEKSDRFRRQKLRQSSRHNERFGQGRDNDDDMDAALADRIEAKRARKAARKRAAESRSPPTPIVLPDYISVGNLATALKVRVEDFTGKLKQLGFTEVTVDHMIDAETAGLVAREFNFEPTLPKEDEDEDLVALPEPDDKSLLLNRPPVITIMGHVDHGKTTLLDWLRKSSVVASEHGGITQHIGAFTVPMPSGRVITFLDTPGHAAFLSMRARGANVTDIVILVVAADDSVKPQTIEAIKHAKDAQVPVIVAINKMDKADANAQRVKEDLARHGVEVEDFGGEVQTVEVSGKSGEGMDALEEAALALADVLDVRAPTNGSVEGWVLESSAKRAGKVATVLVRRGTLQPGDVLVAGKTWTRIRSLHDANGAALDSVGPGVPALVDGWREQPEAGDEVLQASGEQRAKRAVAFRVQREEDARLAQVVSMQNQARSDEKAAAIAAQTQAESGEDAATLQEAAAQRAAQAESSVLELPIVLRADVSGSVEAVDAYIHSLSSPLIRPKVLRALVGPATPSDAKLAELTNGALVSFNVTVPGPIALAAERAGVPLISGNVIYRLADAVKAEMEARLPEKIRSRVLGEAEVLQIFHIGLGGGKGKLPVAGVKIGNGLMKRGGRVRVLRGGKMVEEGEDIGGRKGATRHRAEEEQEKDEVEKVVYDGQIATLRSHQKEVAEVRKGSECGLSFDGGFAGFEVGDRVQLYEEIREKQTL
jgi:translation initiation factor IF-2